MDFLNSKVFKDFMNGQLPPVEVKVSTENLVQIGLVVVVAGVIVMLAGKIIKVI